MPLRDTSRERTLDTIKTLTFALIARTSLHRALVDLEQRLYCEERWACDAACYDLTYAERAKAFDEAAVWKRARLRELTPASSPFKIPM